MANTKITYLHAEHFDKGAVNCGFGEETDYIITDGVFDFGDWLDNNNVPFEYDEAEGVYFVLEKDVKDPERTGEAYMITSTEQTDEELIG